MTDAKLALIKAVQKAEREKWEAALWLALKGAGISGRFQRQYKAIEGREYRYDFASVSDRLLVEVNGGLWMKDAKGRARGHAHPQAIIRDYEKLNAAAVRRWTVLFFAPSHVESGEALITILEAIGMGSRE